MSITWVKIIGQSPDFNLEARIFNGVCFFSAGAILFGTIGNLLFGSAEIAVSFVAVFVCISLCYYFSRFKAKSAASILAYMIIINLLNLANFRYNGGINGPALLVFTLSNFLAVSIIPKRQYWFWISLNILVVSSLLFIQYQYPQVIFAMSREERFIRQELAYMLTLFY